MNSVKKIILVIDDTSENFYIIANRKCGVNPEKYQWQETVADLIMVSVAE